jgi:hypothetical protein
MYMYISEGCLSKIDILESTWIPGNHIPLTGGVCGSGEEINID